MLVPVGGGGGASVTPVPHDQPIDQQKVQLAVREASVNIPLNASNLANILTSPNWNLNQAEQDQVIKDLARQGGLGSALEFYANDAARGNGDDYTSLQADEAVIGDAVQQAYADGAIDTHDLVHIADASQVPGGGGGQRFLDVLMQGGAASEKGSAAEVLADALWARNGNNGVDRAAAAMYYSSNALTMQNDLKTPAMREQAFTALVNFNQTGPYSGLPNNQLVTGWKNQALAAEANLFAANGQELTNELAPNGSTPDVLAQFFSQTVFNPSAQNIQLDDGSTLKSDMHTALQQVSSSLIGAAQQAKPPGGDTQTNLLSEYANLYASLTAGAQLGIKNFNAQVQANDASRQQFASLVGGALGSVVPGVGSVAVGTAATDIAGSVLQALNKDPHDPAAAVQKALHGEFEKEVTKLSAQSERAAPQNSKSGVAAAVTGALRGTYSDTLSQLQTDLNIIQ